MFLCFSLYTNSWWFASLVTNTSLPCSSDTNIWDFLNSQTKIKNINKIDNINKTHVDPNFKQILNKNGTRNNRNRQRNF